MKDTLMKNNYVFVINIRLNVRHLKQYKFIRITNVSNVKTLSIDDERSSTVRSFEGDKK